jgi:hypothetical protein
MAMGRWGETAKGRKGERAKGRKGEGASGRGGRGGQSGGSDGPPLLLGMSFGSSALRPERALVPTATDERELIPTDEIKRGYD